MKKKLFWIIAAALAAVAVFLTGLRLSYPGAGAYLALAIAVVALAWLAPRGGKKALKDEVEALRKTVRDLDRELTEKSNSRLNVVDLNPIMHIAVLNVDTSFVRPYVREEGKMTFQGALRADLRVEYGIRMEDVLFRYDKMTNNLLLANFHPGIISYSRKQLKWEFARSFRTRKFLGLGFPDVSDKEADAFTTAMCEKLRNGLEEEIDTRNVSEFEWLSPLITDQVVDIIKLMVGRDSLTVSIVESPDQSFVSLQDFRQQLALPGAGEGE